MEKRFVLWLLVPIFAAALCGRRADAAVRTWPGATPCAGGLQACIDGASAGDVILLAADVPAGSDVSIEKSLTVRPVPGMAAPLVGADFDVSNGPGGETVDVRLQQLHFSGASVTVSFLQGEGHAFALADSIVEVDLQSRSGVQIDNRTHSKFLIERNTIDAGWVWGVSYTSTAPADGSSSVIVRQNRITRPTPGKSYGGLYFNLMGEGQTGASIHSNLLYDLNDGVAGAAAIKIDAHDTTANNFQIINNTIDDVHLGHGIYVPAPDAGATLYVFVYSNIVSNVAQNWLQLPAAQPSFDVFHNYNTFYLAGSSGYGGFPPGAQTSNENPQYLDPPYRNYALGVFSPCVNSAVNSVASGIPARDVNGLPRVLGGTADRGAFERPVTLLTSYVAFSDFFSDAALDPSYAYDKGDWSEDGLSLLATTPKKSSMRLADAMQCGPCSFAFDLGLAATPSKTAKLSVLLWYQSPKSYVDLVIKPRAGVLLLREHVGGRIVRKAKAAYAVEPFQTYRFRVRYDGSSVAVDVNENGQLSLEPRAAHAGGFGFQTKRVPGFLSQVVAYW